MKKILLLASLILMFSIVSFAQILEDGKATELKNLKKVYIDSDVAPLDYKKIRAEFIKANIRGLQIVDNADAADFALFYANEKSSGETEKNPVPFGMGMVALHSPDGSKIRVVMRYQSKLRERNTAVKFARAVIAKYKAVNKIK